MASTISQDSAPAIDVDAWRARIRAETFGSYHLEMGIALRREGASEKALESFERALGQWPTSSAAHFELITTLDEMGRTVEAEQARRRALAVNPRYVREGLLERARAHRLANAEDALALYPQVAEAWPECAEAQVFSSYWYEVTNRPVQAAAAWDKAVRAPGGFDEEARSLAQSYYRLAIMRMASTVADTSIPCFERAVALEPERSEFLIQMLQALASIGLADRAVAMEPAAKALFPADAGVEMSFVASHLISGDFRKAMDRGERCARIAPDNVDGALFHGLACLVAGDIEASAALLNTPRVAAVPHGATYLGLLLHTQGHLAEAEAAHDRTRRDNPQDVFAMVNLALLYEDTGRRQEAEDLHLKAIAGAPRLLRALAHLRPVWARDRLLRRYDVAGI
ncbi:tetratricopeptide repeat protein [Azospirillum argentinense]